MSAVLAGLRRRLPRPTIRLRLTLTYGSLFLISGAVLLTVTYLLVSHTTSGTVYATNPAGGTALIGVNASGQQQVIVKAPTDVTQPPFGAVGFPNPPSPEQLQGVATRLNALSQQQHDDQLHTLLTVSLIALGGMAVLSIGFGWLVAGRVLRPLRTITDAAQSISASNLHRRLGLRGANDEIKELGSTIDSLLGRLEQSFDAQRQFVANASHELRTPLARQRTIVEVGLRDASATVESLRAGYERVLAAGEQQERIIEALLTLARSERGLDHREPCDLAAITEEVLITRTPDADARGLRIDATLGGAPALGDAQLLERLVTNLVDNAVRHNVSGGRVVVVTRVDAAGRALLHVSNTGAVIPAGEIERLFQPFQRLAAERGVRSDGVGLGLCIVKAIADAHGAALRAWAPPEGGLAVEVMFPAG